MSFARSDNEQVFATARALDTKFKSASPSESIMPIPEAGNWVPNILRNLFVMLIQTKVTLFKWIIKGWSNFSS